MGMPELTVTSPKVHSRVDPNSFTMGKPMPESTLPPRHGLFASADSFKIFIEDVSFTLSLACLLYDPYTALEYKSYFAVQVNKS
jgi:hypothetical protein